MNINQLNATTYRIIWSVTTACLLAIAFSVAMLFFGWSPDAGQKWVMIGLAGALLTMMGYDVTQFGLKRWTDIDFATAKNAKVQVEAPSTVVTSGDTTVVTKTPAPTDDEEDISATDALQAAAALNAAPRGLPVGMHVPGQGD